MSARKVHLDYISSKANRRTARIYPNGKQTRCPWAAGGLNLNTVNGNEKIGITTTVPVEVILAAGLAPADLNNLFVASPFRDSMLAAAHGRGFPTNVCAWIKGLYAAARENGIERVAGVTRGDCSSTEKLLEVWRHDGLETVEFAYPSRPDPESAGRAVEGFALALGTAVEEAERVRKELAPVREMLARLDEATWRDMTVTGRENHLWLVSSSDMEGDPRGFGGRLEVFLDEVSARRPAEGRLRLGYAGVPPIVDDLYDFLEDRGARVVLNEVQRQFSMPGAHAGLAEQYAAYTYPYDTAGRIDDIAREIERRGIRGVIHYSQTFCHRQIESILFRERLPVPLLVIEADAPGPLDGRTRTRIEAFLEQLRAAGD